MPSYSTTPSILANSAYSTNTHKPAKKIHLKLPLVPPLQDSQGDSTSFSQSPSSPSQDNSESTDLAQKKQFALSKMAEFENNWRKHSRKLSTDEQKEISDEEEVVGNIDKFLTDVSKYQDVRPEPGEKPVSDLKQSGRAFQRKPTFPPISALWTSLTQPNKRKRSNSEGAEPLSPTSTISAPALTWSPRMKRGKSFQPFNSGSPFSPISTKSAPTSPTRGDEASNRSFSFSTLLRRPKGSAEHQAPIDSEEHPNQILVVDRNGKQIGVMPDSANGTNTHSSRSSIDDPSSFPLDSDDERYILSSIQQADPSFNTGIGSSSSKAQTKQTPPSPLRHAAQNSGDLRSQVTPDLLARYEKLRKAAPQKQSTEQQPDADKATTRKDALALLTKRANERAQQEHPLKRESSESIIGG